MNKKVNKTKIEYKDLEKHFIAPKVISPFFKVKRLPRKFKKKWKHILHKDNYTHLTLEQKLWWVLEFKNPDYKRFLIKKVVEHENKIITN